MFSQHENVTHERVPSSGDKLRPPDTKQSRSVSSGWVVYHIDDNSIMTCAGVVCKTDRLSTTRGSAPNVLLAGSISFMVKIACALLVCFC